jgi:hypothetical protein
MKSHNADDIRALSDDVLAIAQAAAETPITDHGWQRLIDAGLMLRKLGGLPPPWADEPAG